MAIVVFNGKSYECARAVKGVDYVKLYDENNAVIIAFSGISDFSAFTLTEGEWETGVSTQTVAAYAELVNGIIQLTLLRPISVETGLTITFQAPCDCTESNGVSILGTNYTLVDAAGVALEAEFKAFAQNAMVRVILHTDENKAYIQNGAATTIEAGGTGANNAADALNNLGITSDVIKNIDKHYWKRQKVELSTQLATSTQEISMYEVTSSGPYKTFPFYYSENIELSIDYDAQVSKVTLKNPQFEAYDIESYKKYTGKYISLNSDGSEPVYYVEAVTQKANTSTVTYFTVTARQVFSYSTILDETELIYAENIDAYPNGLYDNYLYDYRGIIEENILYGERVEVGSYIGTGESWGANNTETIISFNFVPKIVFIVPPWSTYQYYSSSFSPGIRQFVYGYSPMSIRDNNTSFITNPSNTTPERLYVEWDGTTMKLSSWGTSDNAINQCNSLGVEYTYIAFS